MGKYGDATSIGRMLLSGEIHEVKPKDFKMRSEAYNNYMMLFDNERAYIDYVICKICRRIFKHDISISGTTHLVRHTQTHEMDEQTAEPQVSIFTFCRHSQPVPRADFDYPRNGSVFR